jgi:hypothetical protein
MFIQGEKMTSDTGEILRFWAYWQLAREYYRSREIISYRQFDEIDWWQLRKTLLALPRLFQLWAAKHVNKIAGTMSFLSHQDGRCDLCPSCGTHKETCQHIARCPEVGRVAAFAQATNNLELWLRDNKTHPDVQALLLEYTRRQGKATCLECANDLELPPLMQDLARSQDIIGWDLFMMGMVSKKTAEVQSAHFLQYHHSRPVSK